MSLSETSRSSRKARNGASNPSRETPAEKPSVRIAKSADAAFTRQDALHFHQMGRPGKLEIMATKPVVTQRDLSLAYSPGVAIPVQAIAEDASHPQYGLAQWIVHWFGPAGEMRKVQRC